MGVTAPATSLRHSRSASASVLNLCPSVAKDQVGSPEILCEMKTIFRLLGTPMNNSMRIGLCAFAACALLGFCASGQETNEPIHRLTPVPIQQVTIDDPFWSPKIQLWRQVTLQDCFEKFDHDGAFTNFDRVRDGQSGGHGGPPWYDGLVYEMIRPSADFLAAHPDPELEKQVDGYIQRIAAAAAKDPNGYLETWTELTAPGHRWGLNGGNDLWQHELYNAGALIDAGIHWYRATGRTDLLQVAVRMANDLCRKMGPAPKVNQVPGHPLGE